MGDESDQTKNETSQPSKEGGGKKRGGPDRNAQAKAFYRAMYAGAEPDPEEFGLAEGQQQGGGGGPCANCSRIQAEMEHLEKRTLEAENHYKRMAADFENYRKRVAREKEEFSAAGIQRAIEAILPALDDLDLAKSKLSTDVSPQSMMDSLNMVYNRFNRCLEQIGIKQLEVIGQMFDPKFHEPVQQIPTNEVAEGAIVHQLRPGYMFNDRVLRPSLVNVATAPGGGEYQESSESQEGSESYEQAGTESYEDQGNYAEGEEVTEESGDYAEAGSESGEYAGSDPSVDQSWETEENHTSLTQDLPIVNVDGYKPELFEEKEEAESSSGEES